MIIRAFNKIRSLFKSPPQPLSLFSDEEIDQHYIGPAEQRERIRNGVRRRRESGAILPSLPERPHVLMAGRGLKTSKAGWADSWRKFADVTIFDWGFADEGIDPYGPDWFEKGRPAFQRLLFHTVQTCNAQRHIDLFFSYLSGRWVSPQTIESISRLGIITVNITYDDTFSFWGDKTPDGGFTGDAAIAPFYDAYLSCQSERNVGKYILVGAKPLFMPPGADTNGQLSSATDPTRHRTIAISFIGQKYGLRGKLVDKLRAQGLSVVTRGVGWPEGPASLDEMVRIFQDSLVTLGFGYIGNTTRVGLKGRDFFAPLLGAAYLATYNEELASFFTADKEIVLWKHEKELLEKARFLIENPDMARTIGLAGRRRVQKDYLFEYRCKELLDCLR
jgi:spore maturation protein CgeB